MAKSWSPAWPSAARRDVRRVYFREEGWVDTPVYAREQLPIDAVFAGPAIIEDPGTTVVIHPGNRVEIDGFGNTHIHLKA